MYDKVLCGECGHEMVEKVFDAESVKKIEDSLVIQSLAPTNIIFTCPECQAEEKLFVSAGMYNIFGLG